MEIPGRRRFLQFSLLLTALAGEPLARPCNCIGQEATLTPGDRIRVLPLIRPKDRVTGSMISVSDDTLTFEARGDTRRLALSDIETLQRSTGDKSHAAGTMAGGFMGALAGAAIGASIERAVTDNCYDYCGWGADCWDSSSEALAARSPAINGWPTRNGQTYRSGTCALPQASAFSDLRQACNEWPLAALYKREA